MAARVTDLEYAIDEDNSNLSTEQIDEVVWQLKGICRNSSLEFALRVGAVIIHNFYEGELDAWRDRGPKANSFRKLAQHPHLPLSAGALYRCVAVFELCERLRAPSRWRRLGASHLRTVIGIPTEMQEKLLTTANDEHWSVQLLRTRAQALKAERLRGGRRAKTALERHLGTLERCVRECEGLLQQAELQPANELERSLQLLTQLRASMEQLARAVQFRSKTALTRA